MGSSVINAIIILVAFKVIGCSRRALLWNRQAPIILDLVLSMCFFAACSGKASAQSHDASSTGFADYATELGEDPLLKLRDMTSARYSAKPLARNDRRTQPPSRSLGQLLSASASPDDLPQDQPVCPAPPAASSALAQSRSSLCDWALTDRPRPRFEWGTRRVSLEARHYHDDLLDRRAPQGQ